MVNVWSPLYVQIVVDQLNPGLRNLVNLGKSYEKAVTGTDFKLTKVCFSTSLGVALWKHQTSLAVNWVEIRLMRQYLLINFSPLHINASGICISNTTPNGPACAPEWAINSMCFSPSCAAMTLAGKAYFEAVSKLGENAVVSLVSRELGEFHAGPGSIVSGWRLLSLSF